MRVGVGNGGGEELIVQLEKLDYQFGQWGVFAGGWVFLWLGHGVGRWVALVVLGGVGGALAVALVGCWHWWGAGGWLVLGN